MAASEKNHTSITGPNTRPTFSVPKRCARNTSTRITTDNGTMKRCNPGAAISRPSTAPSTVMAGVITLSPKNIDAPKMPRMPTTYADREPFANVRWASAISAMMPPSPWLSARMMMVTYFAVTTIISAQNTSESMPSTVAWSTTMPSRWAKCGENASLSV